MLYSTPKAPTNLAAAVNEENYSSIRLTWDEPPESPANVCSPIIGYKVYGKAEGEENFSLWHKVEGANGGAEVPNSHYGQLITY